ncbi:hypothetical protein ABEB36_012631 [Hypothenemus hampei]|uniref:Gamma-interferon-inducible lysosomal thiol reductase n=1 Tax=Hypothenemus hampei TaxID=57062 RepID=A0ABD1EBW6_HYPHA
MKVLVAILFFSFALCQARNIAVEDVVQVQLYYESLCPYSIDFIVNQLYPAYKDLSKYINLELVPWGNAHETTVNGTKQVTCQHGVDECYGNKVHSCALNITSVDISTAFIACAEGADSPTETSTFQECATSNEISWDVLDACVTSSIGDELLSENGEKTAKVNLPGVPYIVIDQVFTDENEAKARSDFRGLICSLIPANEQCNI